MKTCFVAEMHGEVILAHCNCVAGLCEACSHVGAILFAVEVEVRMRDSVTCTQEKSQWIMPSYVKEIPYSPVYEIDFSSAKKRQQSLGQPSSAIAVNRAEVQGPSVEEQTKFYQNISKCGVKPAILSLIQPFSALFVPKDKQALPKPLTKFYCEQNLKMGYEELVKKNIDVFNSLKISSEEAVCVESCTRGQATTKVWFEQRAGRITASKFKGICSTKPSSPSPSLIKSVCYPHAHRFSSNATRWGIENESKAREAYEFAIAADHINLSVANCGLHINKKWPFPGASPDVLVFCDCCGIGVYEFKCPYKYRDSVLTAAKYDSTFCLKANESDAGMHLDTKHSTIIRCNAKCL